MYKTKTLYLLIPFVDVPVSSWIYRYGQEWTKCDDCRIKCLEDYRIIKPNEIMAVCFHFKTEKERVIKAANSELKEKLEKRLKKS